MERKGSGCMCLSVNLFLHIRRLLLSSIHVQAKVHITRVHKGMGLSQLLQLLLLTHCDTGVFRKLKFAFAPLEYSFISCYNAIMSVKFKKICKTVFSGIIFQNLCECFFSCHVFFRDMSIQNKMDSSA